MFNTCTFLLSLSILRLLLRWNRYYRPLFHLSGRGLGNEERIKQLMFEKYHLKTKLVGFHGSLSSCAIKVEFC